MSRHHHAQDRPAARRRGATRTMMPRTTKTSRQSRERRRLIGGYGLARHLSWKLLPPATALPACSMDVFAH